MANNNLGFTPPTPGMAQNNGPVILTALTTVEPLPGSSTQTQLWEFSQNDQVTQPPRIDEQGDVGPDKASGDMADTFEVLFAGVLGMSPVNESTAIQNRPSPPQISEGTQKYFKICQHPGK